MQVHPGLVDRLLQPHPATSSNTVTRRGSTYCSRGPERQDARERQWYQQIVDQVVDSSPLKPGCMDEQAAAITFLASDEASYITGTVLPVAGGDLG